MVKVHHHRRQSQLFPAERKLAAGLVLLLLLLLAGSLLVVALVVGSMSATGGERQQQQRGGSSSSASTVQKSMQDVLHVAQIDADIVEGSVRLENNGRNSSTSNMKQPEQQQSRVAYLHCGPRHTPSYGKTKGHGELLLLHGARYTKEEWKRSGIMKNLCRDTKRRPGLSVTALDLSVDADGAALVNAFNALVADRVLSGDHVVVVTPSASGKAVLTLGAAQAQDDMMKSESRSLGDVVAMWVPVACGGALKAEEGAIRAFASASIPVLAIYGSTDPVAGGQSSQRLADLAGATKVELRGGHPVYLDSPKEFVEVLVDHMMEGRDN